MAITTSPDNIPSPTSGDPYNYVVDVAALADGTQDALTQKANMGVGTSTQRTAALSKFPNGALWYDTTTSSEWRRVAGAWVNLGSGLWTAYTPAITGLTLGNGTVVARYLRTGNTINVHVTITIGSTTTMGSPVVSLPATSLTESGGLATFVDQGSTRYNGICRIAQNDFILYAINPSTGGVAIVSSTTPFDWVAGDAIFVDATYEAT